MYGYEIYRGYDDGAGAAHRLVADVDGGLGLDVGQAVVVHDLQNLRLVQASHRLGLLVVVHQNDLLAAGAQQVESGQSSRNLAMLIHDGVSAETALQNGVANIVNVLVQPERDRFALLQIWEMGIACQIRRTAR